MEVPFVFLMTRGRINDDTLQLEKLRPLCAQTFVEKLPPINILL